MVHARLLACAVLAIACGRSSLSLYESAQGGAAEERAQGAAGNSGPGRAGTAEGGTSGVASAGAGSGQGGVAGKESPGCTLRLSTTPADGERDVPTSTDVVAGVVCMEGGEPNWSALGLSVSAHERRVEGRVSSDVYLSKISFVPERPLALAATFDVELVDTSTGVSAGAWRFTTRDGRWQRPTIMTGTDLALTVDDADHALLFLATSGLDEVWSTRYRTEERAWGDPERFPRRARGPIARIDRQGGTTLAWGEYQNGSPSVWAARTVAGGQFSPVELEAPDAPYSGFETAAFRTDGTGLVVWSDNPTSSGYDGRLLARAFGGDTDGEPEYLARDTGVDSARAAVEPDGGAWVVWGETLPTGDTIRAQHRSPFGDWQPAETLGAGPVGNPRVAVGGGRAIFLWTESSREERVTRLLARTFDARTGWGEVEALDAIGDRPTATDYSGVAYPQIAMDEAGNALALWTTTVSYVIGMMGASTSYGNRTQIRTQRYEAASGWAAAHVPLGGAAENGEYRIPIEPCVAFDAYGNALALWSEGREEARAQAARFLFDSGWQEPVTLVTSRSGSSGPRVALDALGRGFAAWHAQPSSGAAYQLFAVRFSDE